jgi:3-hydroxyisobutyrate dehydrogenase
VEQGRLRRRGEWPCDLIVAAENAEFSDPVVFLGIGGVEHHGHTWELGPRKAKEILFTGRAVTAREAEQTGMVNRVVDLDRLQDETMGLARHIAQMDAFALRQAKRGQPDPRHPGVLRRHPVRVRHPPHRPRERDLPHRLPDHRPGGPDEGAPQVPMNNTSSPRVGFIGLGSQGGPMARRIIEAGYPVTLWARRPATLEPFADTSAKTAGSPAELAAASDLVGVCVRDDADTEEVVDAVLGGLAAGGVIAVHSTVHPDTCRRLAERAQAGGVRLVDAPVSGGAPAAEAGRLLVMVGGDEEAVEFCRPVFGSYGDPIVHLGPVGAGQVTKLLNNAAFTAHLGVAVSLLALGQSLGVDQLRLADVISHGSGNGFALERVASAGGTLARIGGHAGHPRGRGARGDAAGRRRRRASADERRAHMNDSGRTAGR